MKDETIKNRIWKAIEAAQVGEDGLKVATFKQGTVIAAIGSVKSHSFGIQVHSVSGGWVRFCCAKKWKEYVDANRSERKKRFV